jgi:hypothetical protein
VQQHAKREEHRYMPGEKCLWNVRYWSDSMPLHVSLGSEKMNYDGIPFEFWPQGGDENYKQDSTD